MGVNWLYDPDRAYELTTDKINQLCSVKDVNVYDPDRAYELTTDNVKKILAIHMRFR